MITTMNHNFWRLLFSPKPLSIENAKLNPINMIIIHIDPASTLNDADYGKIPEKIVNTCGYSRNWNCIISFMVLPTHILRVYEIRR